MVSLNYYEKEHEKISVGTLIEIYNPQMILCNNITDVDEDLAMDLYSQTYIEDEDGNEWYDEIYQFFIVDDPKVFERLGYPTAESEVLNLNVVGITHFGMSWNYILSDISTKDEEFKRYFE